MRHRLRDRTTCPAAGGTTEPVPTFPAPGSPERRTPILLLVALLTAVGLATAPPALAQSCPAGALATSKSSALYLYMATSVDNTFPSYGGESTSPLNPFDMASHDGSIGTSQVRQRVLDLVRAGYCEFDVEVKLATSTPSPTESRWQIVGIGSDTTAGPVGKAQAVDTGDADAQDYSRVWVENLESWTGSALSGSSSTLERWATAIANLAAHESAHNYGALHSESAPRPGEDATPNHFIADPAAGATPTSIAGSLNHFSDRTYERFGHDLGLNVKTLHNWDFVNPNGTDADSLVVRLLSTAPSLTLGWVYNGSLSPWTNPTVTLQPGPETYRGTSYNVFHLEFSTAKSWSGGGGGVAPPGEKFHVGASFSESVIVYETILRNGGSDLPLKPRMFGYDAGTASPEFAVTFFNPQAEAEGDLVLSDLRVLFLPRMVDIEQMVEGGDLVGLHGLPVRSFPRQPREERAAEGPPIRQRLPEPVRIGDEPYSLPVAHVTDRRHLDVTYEEGYCEPASGQLPAPAFGDPRVVYCPRPGTALSLFPATYTFVVATVTDPDARHWDPDAGAFVDGPLATRLFFQVAGIVPDANRNGVDDLLDIRTGTSRDADGDGIPDEAQGGRLALLAHFGAAFPEGRASRFYDRGTSLDLGLEATVTPQLSLVGLLGYDSLDRDRSEPGSGDDLELLHLSAGARYHPFPGAPLLPFLQGTVGVYDLRPGDTEIGGSVGAGVRWDVAPHWSLEAVYRRHRVATPGPFDLELSTAQVGLRWEL